MATPIELHFYNKNNEIIKTYKQERVTWDFLKQAVKINDVKTLDDSNIDIIADFVCKFYGYRFSIFGKKANKKILLRYTDVDQLLAVAGQIINRVIKMMHDNGVSLPNAQSATEI